MKLKKLLPIASLAGVAAVVAPLVTSCGSKEFVIRFDDTNPAYQWHPENYIKAEESKKVWQKDATEDYLTAVKKNKQILAEDLIYSAISDFKKENASPYGEATVKINKIEPKTGKCSFSFAIDVGTGQKGGDSLIREISVNNMEYVMYYYDDSKNQVVGWNFIPFVFYMYEMLANDKDIGRESALATVIAYLKSTSDWSFTTKIKLNIHGQNKDFAIEINSDTDDEVIAEFFSSDVFEYQGVEGFVFANMYYYQNVECRDVEEQ